ncbi:hypothetical protein BKA57DRAFT_446717 [Linnemannia elongata]|nr:hypothetical protein BKA57DRAFT_446717 [Linnemannia elongata]
MSTSVWKRLSKRVSLPPKTKATAATATTTPTKNAIQQTLPPPPSHPLDIIEILEHIFSYLDEFTIKETAILVCRKWFLINRLRSTREVVLGSFMSNSKFDRNLSRISGASRLSFYVFLDATVSTQEQHRRKLVMALQRNHTRQIKRQKRHRKLDSLTQWTDGATLERLLDRSLEELNLIGYVQPELTLPPILPYLSTLLRVHLQISGGAVIKVADIVQACPLLQELYVGIGQVSWSDLAVELPRPWLPSRNGSEQGSPLPLRSLVLEDVCFPQKTLESFLAVTPQLTVLKLINLVSDNLPHEELPEWEHLEYNWPKLSKRLKDLQLPLKAFHFSVSDRPMTDDEFKEMLLVCRGSTEWTVPFADVTLTMIVNIKTFQNVLTSLELFGTDRPTIILQRALHYYLCDSPHLLHLRAPRAAFLVEHLDVYYRGKFAYTKQEVRGNLSQPVVWGHIRPGVWACRKLLTLHMEFHSHEQPLLSSAVTTRILFGYIARVLPRLRELFVDTAECYRQGDMAFSVKLNLQLEGGLCLLAKLKDLERLRIGSYERQLQCSLSDLNWMVPSGQSKRYREKRQTTIERLDSWLEEERWLELAAVRAVHEEEEDLSTSWVKVEPALKLELYHLGLFLDVKRMVSEMASVNTFRCWPRMRRLSLFYLYDIGRSPEMELERMFK